MYTAHMYEYPCGAEAPAPRRRSRNLLSGVVKAKDLTCSKVGCYQVKTGLAASSSRSSRKKDRMPNVDYVDGSRMRR